MQKRKGNSRRILRWLAMVLLGLFLTGGVTTVSADRLSTLLRNQERTRAQLRQIKRVQKSTAVRLREAQQELGVVRVRLRDIREQLGETRAELKATEERLEHLEKKKQEIEKIVEEHLLALYKSPQTTYLDVLVESQSFDDLVNRTHYVQVLVNQDEYLLNRLTELQKETDAQRALLQEKEARRAQLAREITQDEATARTRKVEVRGIMHDANTKRAAAESMLAAMEAEENEVRSFLRSRRGGSSSYSGSWSGDFLRPVPGRISSRFGSRVHPITGRRKLHTGVDIAAGHGTTIKAAAKGKVIRAGYYGAYGNTVMIDHGSRVVTWYAHCSSINVRVGQAVRRGQAIARVGSTGMSTGPHLHFSVLKNGDFVDPLKFKMR